VFARQRLEGDVDDLDDLEGLGNRELDRGYDWGSHVGRYPNVLPGIWEQVKAENPTRQEVTDSDTSPDKLNAEQRKLYDLCVAQYTQELFHELDPEQPMPEQLLLNLDGVAGAGKTFALLKSSGRLREMSEKLNPVFRAAPTGIAAFNIVGKTLHSLLRLPVKAEKLELSAATLQQSQIEFKRCRFLIIDEKSTIDLETHSLSDRRSVTGDLSGQVRHGFWRCQCVAMWRFLSTPTGSRSTSVLSMRDKSCGTQGSENCIVGLIVRFG
jgi:hypothetical protein